MMGGFSFSKFSGESQQGPNNLSRETWKRSKLWFPFNSSN